MFSVLPAVDLTHGRLGAYSPEGPVPVEAFEGDPLAAARSFVEAGARWLHVVDMDLAFEGTVANAETVVTIREAFPDVAIQASGGIRTPAEATAFLSAGAARVVIGSAALGDERGFAEIAAVTGGRYLVGIEVVDGRICRGAGSRWTWIPHGDPGMAHGDRGTGLRGDRRRQGRLGIGSRRCHRQARGAIGETDAGRGGSRPSRIWSRSTGRAPWAPW